MHPCGVVLSRHPIASLTPTFTSAKGYATTHFDMDAVEQVGLVKMDILAQGGLAVIRDGVFDCFLKRASTPDLENLAPWEDAEIWQMIASGNARGVHHIESPAMISTRPDVQRAGQIRLPHCHRVRDPPRCRQRREEDAVCPARAGLGAGGVCTPVPRTGAALDLWCRRLRGTHPPNL